MAAASQEKPQSRLWLPRFLEPRVGQLRRDLEAVIAGLRGQRAPSWLPRDGSRYRSDARSKRLATYELEVVEVVRETDSAVSLNLRDPSGQPLPSVRPGQFFTLLVELEGETLRRAYSVSSDCRDREQLRLTIKRVAGGRVSNYLNDEARPGMRLRVLGPSGEFGCAPEPERTQARELVLIAGGSGITPMMAIITTLLPSEPSCSIALIYANRSADQVIFAEALRELEAAHGERLRVHPILEQAPPGWTGTTGICDRPTLAGLLDAEPLAARASAEFLLCGPAPMMDGARELLLERGLAASRIRSENFLAPQLPQLDPKATAKLSSPQAITVAIPQAITVVIDGREVGVVVQPGQSILEAGLAAGLPMPYSCAMGGCAACKVKLERGAVIMRSPNCLSASERAAGYVLACVANPSEPCRVRVGGPKAS
ncbi:MAG: ferredoxin--NADP reductase [Enhygromyxa sp.]